MEVPFAEVESTGVILATVFKVRNGKQEQSLAFGRPGFT